MASPPPPPPPPPSCTYNSIIIVGSGVFGLTTALHLLLLPPPTRPTKITLIDKSPFPAPDGASIDSSRIVRADYKDAAYAQLGARALSIWRGGAGVYEGLGGEGRYTQSGLLLVANTAPGGEEEEGMGGESYVRQSLENVVALDGVEGVRGVFNSRGEIEGCVGGFIQREGLKEGGGGGAGSGLGDTGYLNTRSGWADAEASMRFVRRRVEEVGRGVVEFVVGEVVGLEEVSDTNVDVGKNTKGKETKVNGVLLRDGSRLTADLTVLAMGAWTPGLLDLRGRAVSTGQVIGYVSVTAEEEARYKDMPVILNLSTGLFVLPPRNGVLKVARHAVGYVNPVPVTYGQPDGRGPPVLTSLPITAHSSPPNFRLPQEASASLRSALRDMVPEFGDREFTSTRICWYTDTPTADFIVSYVPNRQGLFVATGGSGHAFKFLPVLGEEIVGVMYGLERSKEYAERWRWRERVAENVVTLDGSRGKSVQSELRKLLEEEGEVQVNVGGVGGVGVKAKL
ncbi:FAD dependent oxidoreductase [Peziza echinospora]|nr:FAD dependent oxidoreductase [Peziza echinospora]